MSDEPREPSGEEALQNLIPLTEAAKISGFTNRHLRLLLHKGIVWGKKYGRDWFTTETAIREYLATERRPGRKKKAI